MSKAGPFLRFQQYERFASATMASKCWQVDGVFHYQVYGTIYLRDNLQVKIFSDSHKSYDDALDQFLSGCFKELNDIHGT